MKYFMFVLLFLGLSFANSSDCISCHQVLNNEKNIKEHKVLNSCSSCHIKSSLRVEQYRQDCFLCHDRNQIVKTEQKEHQALFACITCHKPKESLLEITDRTSTLLDILNQK